MNRLSTLIAEHLQGLILGFLLIEVILALASTDPNIRLFRYQGF